MLDRCRGRRRDGARPQASFIHHSFAGVVDVLQLNFCMVGGCVRLSSWLINCNVRSCCGPFADQKVVVGPVERPASLIFNAGFGWELHHARDFHVEGGRVRQCLGCCVGWWVGCADLL